MESHYFTGNFNFQQYKGIATEIDEKTFDYLIEQIKKQMPDSHATFDTLYYIILRLTTRAICVICGDDQTTRQKIVTEFCKTLPKLVQEAKIITASIQSNLKQ